MWWINGFNFLQANELKAEGYCWEYSFLALTPHHHRSFVSHPLAPHDHRHQGHMVLDSFYTDTHLRLEWD